MNPAAEEEQEEEEKSLKVIGFTVNHSQFQTKYKTKVKIAKCELKYTKAIMFLL